MSTVRHVNDVRARSTSTQWGSLQGNKYFISYSQNDKTVDSIKVKPFADNKLHVDRLIISVFLTLSQTTNFRLFQIERV